MVHVKRQIVCAVVLVLLGLCGCNRNSKQAAQNASSGTPANQTSTNQSASSGVSSNSAGSDGIVTTAPGASSNNSAVDSSSPLNGANAQQQQAQPQQPEPLGNSRRHVSHSTTAAESVQRVRCAGRAL